MDDILSTFQDALDCGNGTLLSSTILPVAPSEDPTLLHRVFQSGTESTIGGQVRAQLHNTGFSNVRLSKSEVTAWADVFVAYWKAVREIIAVRDGRDSSFRSLYLAWKSLTNSVIKGYVNSCFALWTLPCLYVVGRYLRIFAIRADEEAQSYFALSFNVGIQDDFTSNLNKRKNLEDAARVINRIFTLCINDRASIEGSRKWGIYYTANLMFKTYFKLNSINLCKNILRALQAAKSDLPEARAFPKSHIVTFKYYAGVIMFLEEDYIKAEEHLTEAWRLCHKKARHNKELILNYLIPCHLLTSRTLPSSELLAPYPRLRHLFGQLTKCIRLGDLGGFDSALTIGKDEFIKRRIYLTLERGRDVTLRNLFRKVFISAGFEKSISGQPMSRKSRIPIKDFEAAIHAVTPCHARRMDVDEVECLLTNMIYKDLIKGYIARNRGIVVLSTKAAFPGTGV